MSDRSPFGLPVFTAVMLALIPLRSGAQEPPSVRAFENLSIGQLGPEEYTFGRVSSLVVTWTGLIVVGDARNNVHGAARLSGFLVPSPSPSPPTLFHGHTSWEECRLPRFVIPLPSGRRKSLKEKTLRQQ